MNLGKNSIYPIPGILNDASKIVELDFQKLLSLVIKPLAKGKRAFADLRHGKEDSISPSTLIFHATKD